MCIEQLKFLNKSFKKWYFDLFRTMRSNLSRAGKRCKIIPAINFSEIFSLGSNGRVDFDEA